MVERRRRCRLKIRVMMQINAFQRLDRGPEEPGGVGQWHACLHRPGDRRVLQRVRRGADVGFFADCSPRRLD